MEASEPNPITDQADALAQNAPPQDPQNPQQPQAPAPRLRPLAEPLPQPVDVTAGLPDRIFQRLVATGAADTEAANQELLRTFSVASQTDPAVAGEAQRLAKEFGIDPGQAAANLDVARAWARQQDLQRRDLIKEFPVTAQMLKNVQFAQVAQDDLDQLTGIEGFFRGIRNAYNQGELTNEVGMQASKLLKSQLDGEGPKPDDVRQLAWLNARLHALPQPEGFIQGAVSIIGQMATTIPAAAAAGWAGARAGSLFGPGGTAIGGTLGSLGAVFTQTALIEAGNAFNDMLELGLDRDSAAKASLGIGVVNGVLETVGEEMTLGLGGFARRAARRAMVEAVAKSMEKPVLTSAAINFAKRWVTGMAGEVGTEVMQEIASIAGESYARGKTPGADPNVPDIGKRLADIAITTAVGMTLIAGIGPTGRLIEDARAVARASHEQQFLTNLTAKIDASKLKELNPDALEKHIQATAKGKVENIYVDGDVLHQLINDLEDDPEKQQAALKKLAEIAPDAQKQMAAGEDVVIPIEKLVPLAGSELQVALKPHMKLSPGSLSMAEAEVLNKTAPEREKAAKELLEEKEQNDLAFFNSAQQVEKDIAQQLIDAGRPKEEATTIAVAYRNFIALAAAETGVMPEEFHRTRGIKARFSPEAVANGEAVTQLEDELQQTAGWDEQRVQNLLAEHAYSGHKTAAHAVRISPQQFLDLTASKAGQEEIANETGPLDLEQLRRETQTPFLKVRQNADGSYTVVGHEGRHRMTALMRAGVQSVPIVVRHEDAKGYKIATDRADVAEMKLQPQRFASIDREAKAPADGAAGTTLKDLTPISYANQEKLKSMQAGSDVLFQNEDAPADAEKITPARGEAVPAALPPWATVKGTRVTDAQAKASPAVSPKAELAAKNYEKLDAVFAKVPNPLASAQAWRKFMSLLTGHGGAVLGEPIEALRYAANPQLIADYLKQMRPDQLASRREGFELGRKIQQDYREGRATAITTGRLLVWGILSRSAGAFPHESAYMDLVNAGIDEWIGKALIGQWTEADTEAYTAWSKRFMATRKGGVSPASQVTSNANDAGRILLTKLSVKDANGVSALERLHRALASDTSTDAVRRLFFTLGDGIGIQNKVLSFVMLISGRTDTLVLDRVQITHLWGPEYERRALDAGVAPDGNGFVNIYDPPLGRHGVGGLAPLGEGHFGLAIYEALARGLSAAVREGYRLAGLSEFGDGTLGAFHWDSWLVQSSQAIAHPTVEALTTQTPRPDLSVAQGKFDTFGYGTRYRGDGNYEVPLLSGAGRRVMSAAEYATFIESISDPKKGVVPKGFKVSSYVDAPWVDAPEVNRARYDELARSLGQDAGAAVQATSPDVARSADFQRRLAAQRRTVAVQQWRSDRLAAQAEPWTRSEGTGAGSGSLRLLTHLGAGVRGTSWTIPASLAERLRAAGVEPKPVVELEATPESAAAYQQLITASKAGNPFGAAVHVYDAADYQQMRLFVTEDGTSGVAVKADGDLVSGFSTGGNAMTYLLSLAVQNGAVKADSFDTILPAHYAPSGFRVVARIPFDDSQAPKDWDPKVFKAWNNGRPDVVFYVHDPKFFDFYRPGTGVKAASYDEALAIQSGRPAIKQPTVLQQRVNGLYSELQQAVETKGPESAKPAAWVKWLQQGPAKKVEIEWTGILDWLQLAGPDAELTRDQILEYLRDSKRLTVVDEHVLGAPMKRSRGPVLQVHEIGPGADGVVNEWDIEDITEGHVFRATLVDYGKPGRMEMEVTDAHGDPVGSEEVRTGEEGDDALAFAKDIVKRHLAVPTRENPRYVQYTTPGGTNHREFLLKLPNAASFTEEHWQARRDHHTDQGEQVFLHIRVNDRIVHDGLVPKKVLYVEEIQSAWGQEGQKKGWLDDWQAPEWKTDAQAAQAQFGDLIIREAMARLGYSSAQARTMGVSKLAARLDERERFANRWGDRWEEANKAVVAEEMANVQARENAPTVHKAPFVDSTAGWVNLALKRIMLLAAEENYDRVAFVGGEESAKRYGLSQAVEQITAGRTGAETNVMIRLSDGNGIIDAQVADSGRITAAKGTEGRYHAAAIAEQIVGRPLAEAVGEELTTKILATQDGATQTFEGEALSVGGDGMRKFYGNEQGLAHDRHGNVLMRKQQGKGGVVTEAPLDAVVPGALKALLGKLGGKLGEPVNVQPPRSPGGGHQLNWASQGRLMVKPQDLEEIGATRDQIAGVYTASHNGTFPQVVTVNRGDRMVAYTRRVVPAPHTEGGLRGVSPFIEIAVEPSTEGGDVFKNAEAALGIKPPPTPKQMSFDVTPALKEQIAKGLPYFQGARGHFNPRTLEVVLHEPANASTAIHEFGHFFLHTTLALAAEPNASERIKADADIVLRWFGIPGATAAERLANWHGMSLKEQEPHHEAWAYNVEVYVFDGVAPSQELKGVFRRMMQFLRTVYSSIRTTLNRVYREAFGKDLPFFTPEVRGVLDRILASDEQIAQAEQVQAFTAAFTTEADFLKADPNATHDDWLAYQQAAQDAHDTGEELLRRDSLRQMAWVQNARSKRLKELQAQHEQVRSAVRAEVAQEIAQQPVHRARRWLRKGERVVDDRVVKDEGPHKLSQDEVQAILTDGVAEQDLVMNELLPDASTASIAGKPPGEAAFERMKPFMRKEEGLHPDDVAKMFGYQTGEQLVRDLMSAPELGDAIDARAEQVMQERYSELSDPKEIEAAVQEAVHNEARARFLAAQLRHLERSRKPARALVLAARDTAKRILDSRKVKLISMRGELALERRAGQQLEEALKTADGAAVKRAAQKQMLQNALVHEAKQAEDEIEKALKAFEALWGDDDKVGKKRNLDFVNAGRAILSAFGLGHGQKLPLEFVDKIAAYDPAMFAEISPAILRATGANTLQDYRELSLDDFRMVRDIVMTLWGRAAREQTLMLNGKELDKRAAVAEMTAELRKRGSVPGAGEAPTRTLNDKERRGFQFMGLKAWITRIEHWARSIGPAFYKHIFGELRVRVDDYMHDKNVEVKKIRDRIVKLKWWDRQVAAPELGKKGFVFEGRRQLLGALLHSGNESNLEKLLLGYELEERDPETGRVDFTRWWSFIDRMVAEGKLTKEDFDFAQAVWDQNEALKPKAQKTWHNLNGVYFDEVQAVPLITKFGVYRGGYVPAKIDTDMPVAAHLKQRDGLDGLQDLGRDAHQLVPTTGKGFGIKRTAATYPLLLDARLQIQHVDEVLRFIHLQPAVRDILGLIRDQEFSRELNRVDPKAINELLVPWLDRTARQQMAKTSGNPLLDAFFSFLRRTSGMARMFGNVVNALSQATGISNGLTYVEKRHLQNAAWQFSRNPRDMAKRAAELSKFMNEKLTGEMGRMQDDIALAMDPSKWASVQRWTQRHAYFMQHAIQNPVDIIIWHGAFDQAMSKSGADAGDTEAVLAAVHEADSAVRLSQGSSAPVDVARYEAGTTFARLFTQFSGYSNNILNAIMHAKPGMERAKVAFQSFLLPGVATALITQVLAGGWDDDDKDGYLDEVAAWFFGGVARDTTSLVPVAGPAVASLFASAGDRLALSPVISSFQSAFHGVASTIEVAAGEKKKLAGQDIKDLLTAITFATGIPVSIAGPTLGYLRDVETGKAKPTGPIDYARGVITGRR